MHRRFTVALRFCFLFLLFMGIIFPPQSSAYAAGFSITPITWNIMGLDSNNPNVGPYHFPVGVRVCNNTGATATNVTGNFVWDTGGTASAAEIYNRVGTKTTLSVSSLASGACTDFYYEVEISRSLAPYDKARRYHIDVTSTETGTTKYSSPAPREIYVEHLISQSRNYVQNVLLSSDGSAYNSIAAGGTMTLMVGNTYWIQVDGYTATQGYNQLEEFINFPNTIFQVLAVNTTYSADSSLPPGGYVPDPNGQLYADGCKWDSDPGSPTYRSCTGIDGKAGGHVVTTYKLKILQVPGAPLVNPQPLSTLIYDFSGSSYHYNADYSVSTRYANIVNASISKAFSPKTIAANGTSTLRFSVKNPGGEAISKVNFSDTFPSGLTLANTTVTYTGCGASPSPSSLSVGSPQVLSFSNLTVAGNSTCTIDMTVTASSDNSYPNTTGHLFVDTTDTLSTASDTLVVSSQPAPPSSCTSRSNLATWTFDNYTASATINSGPFAASSLPGTGVTSGQATFGNSGASTSAIANPTTYPNAAPNNWGNNLQPSATGNSGNSWGINTGWLADNPANPTTATTPYFQFRVDGAGNYGGLGITTNYNLQGNWSNAQSWYVISSSDGINWSSPTASSAVWNNANAWQVAGITVNTTTSVPTVYFRVFAAGAQNSTATMYVDNVSVTGCPRPVVPTLSKSFSPTTISQGSASTLTFTFGNSNSTSLSAISFSDTLPTGLVVGTPNGLSAISCTSGSVSTTPTITATEGTSTISVSGLGLAANSTCSFSVSVKGITPGTYTNTSGNITSTDSGPNSTAAGYGTSSLTVIAPPVINKAFTANPIFTNNSTALTFTINNPNTSTGLTGVSFTDDLTQSGGQSGLVVATPNGLSNTCGGTATATEGSTTISLNGVSLAAGATCKVTVNVTGNTAGLKNNSVTVSSANGGTGNTSTASVLVKAPSPAIKVLKQVASSDTGPWSSFLTTTVGSPVYYKVSVENVGDVALSSIAVSDPNVSLSGCTWTDGDGTVLNPFSSLPVVDADDNQLATCVVGPITGGAVSGLKPNTVTASATSTTSVTSTAKYGTAALTIVKSAIETSFAAAGDTLHYSYVVTNSGGAPLLGPITVSDNKTTVTCPAVNTLGDKDDWLDPADYPTTGTPAESITCTATYTITNADVTAGSVTNIASATAGGVTSNTVSKTVYAPFDLAIAKTNSAITVNAGSSTTYTVRVTNNGPATVAGAILSDPVATGLTKTLVACSTVTPGQCVTAPTVTDLEAGTFALPSLASGQFYEITVTATVSATSGSVTNTATIAAPAGGTDSDTSNNTASDTDTVTPVANLVITKGDGVTTVNAGGTTTYTIRVTNSGPSSVTGAILSDPVVSGLSKTVVACSAIPGQCVAAPNITQLQSGSFPLPVLASGQFYEITVSATVTAASGSITNTATIAPPTGTVDSDNTNNTASDTDTVTPVIDLSLDKQVSTSTPIIGGTITFTLVVTNEGPSTATNIVVTDVVPSGYTYVASSVTGGDSRVDTNPSLTGLTWTVNALASGASLNLTYQATVLGSGTYDNYAEISSHTETDRDSIPGNGQQATDEDDDDTQVVTPSAMVAPSIAKSFSPTPIAVGGTSTLRFTITNSNVGVALTGVSFTDSLPSGMQVASTPDVSTTGCGSPTFAPTAGNTTLTFTGATIAASGTCTVSVNVTATSVGTKNNITGNVSSTNGGTGNTASSSLGVTSAVKTVVATSEDSSVETGAPRSVLIGEVVRYHLVIELPEGTTTNLQFVDSIVANMAYLNDNSTRVAFVCNSGVACASSSVAAIGTNPVISGTSSAVTPIFVLPVANISGDTGNPYGDGVDPTFSFGNVTNNDNDSDAEYVVLEFNSLVRNTSVNQDTDTRGNDFTVYANGSSVVTSTDNANSRVTITEPAITAITKSVTTAPIDAGDTIEYQLQFTNNGSAPAFDITITDTLNAALTTPVSVSGSTTGGNCGTTASTVSGSYTAPTVTATVSCLAAGGTATVNISAKISDTALAGYGISNAASLRYTSLPGTGTADNSTGSVTPGGSGTTNGERDGSGGTDNYTASSNTVNTTLASPSIAKTINPLAASYAIGSNIPYQITITVPEGVTGGPAANLVETIPTGLSYVPGSLTVTPEAGVTIGTASPYTDANASFFNLTGQTMTLTLGSFTSTASSSATNRTVTVTFLARVDNVAGNQSGTSFTNSVDLVRTNPNGAGTVTLTATALAASVVEPDLNVSKSVSSSTPAYNSTLTYTLAVTHTGSSGATASDVQITDTLPAGLTSLRNVNVSSTAGGCATSVKNNSTGTTLDITIGSLPLGCSVAITYDVTVSGATGSTQTNSVTAAWTSQSGSVYERTGADGAGGLNNYVDSDAKSVTVTGPDLRIVKTDGNTTYAAGSSVTYTIDVYNDGSAAATGTVADTFSAKLTGITWTCAGTGGATCTASGSGNINDSVSIPAGQRVTYTVSTTVVASATGDLVNTATATLSAGTDPTPTNNTSTDTDTWNNLLPVAVPDTNTANEGGLAVTGDIRTNDTLGDTPTTVTAANQGGSAITFGTAFPTAAGGSLTLNANGTYSYTPPATLPEGGALTEVFNYTITDANGDTSSSTLTITVDRLPQANPDTNSATEGGSAVTGNTITNDDQGNVSASVTAVSQSGATITLGSASTTAAGGTLTLNSNGSYSYTPPATLPEGGTLTEVINYTITDANGDTSSSILTITVDRLPLANPDTNTATEGGTNATGNVVTNDDEGNVSATVTTANQGGTTVTIGSAFTTPAGGKLTLNADGSYSYTPPAQGSVPVGGLTEVFNYTITDADGDTSSSTLTITVSDNDLFPVAVPDTNTANEGGSAVTGDIRSNDTLGDTPTTVTAASQGGNSITFGTAFSTTAGGSLTLNADGTYSYTPPATLPEGAVMTEVFNYTITDVDGDFSSSTLTITVDRRPQADPDTNTATEGGTAATGNVITNDDEGNTNASVTGATQGSSSLTIGSGFDTAAGGKLTLHADGSYSYTPPATLPEGGTLTEIFNYTITDADGDTNSSTLTITVDRLPQAVADTNTATEGGPAVTGNVVANDDEGNTNAGVVSASQGARSITIGSSFNTDGGGSLTLNADGSYSYTPPAQGNVPPAGLTEVFSYTLNDADGDPSTITLTITVSDSDRLPIAAADTNTAVENGPAINGDVLTNETSLGDTPTTVTGISQGGAPRTVGSAFTTTGGGSLTLNSNGTYTYTPPASVPTAGLTEIFDYTITDVDGDPSSSTLTITVNKSLIGVSKQASVPVEVSAGTYDITYTFLVKNYGGVTLNNIQVTDNLGTIFASPTTFSVQSKSATGLAINPSFNGSTDTNLLTGVDSLAVGSSGTITVVVRVIPLSAGPFNNTAIASGRCPTCTTSVTDNSQTGTNPDPDNDNDPTNNNTPTPVSFGAALFDPPFGLKVFDDSGLPLLQWTMVWINNSNIVAVNAQVSDSIPSGTTYSASGASSGYPLPAGAPAGSTAVGVSCTDTSSSTSTTYCYYEGPTATYTRGRIVWVGTLGPDLGATDAASANNEITITFNVNIDAGITSVQNTATVDTDLDGDTVFALSEQRVASAARTWTAQTPSASSTTTVTLPATGFAPNVVTDMSNVPPQTYLATDDVTVEVPNLNIKIPVVGVPKMDGTWNVSWLGNQAGWLEGSAFPSWNGNSVLTGHVYLSNGLPGPFVNLSKLKYGDKIIINAYGQKYTFEVRANDVVEPNDTSVMKHEEKSWLTLVTCKEYDEKTNMYRKRVVVRAVLVNVTGE